MRFQRGSAMFMLLKVSKTIDKLLIFFAYMGAACGVLLMIAVCTDVVTRHYGISKPFGWNATQLQESEYWLHTFLFTFVIGWAYTRQAHVRIDLIRDHVRRNSKYVIEILGLLFFLFPFSILGGWYCFEYTMTSFASGEASKSTIGLSNIWIPKAALVVMFLLMLLAGVSQFLKCIAGLMGILPDHLIQKTLGGGQ